MAVHAGGFWWSRSVFRSDGVLTVITQRRRGIIHNVARIRPQAPNRVIGANGEAVIVTQETALGAGAVGEPARVTGIGESGIDALLFHDSTGRVKGGYTEAVLADILPR